MSENPDPTQAIRARLKAATPLSERLREELLYGDCDEENEGLLREAAEALDALEAERKSLQDGWNAAMEALEEDGAEHDRLRSALDAAEARIEELKQANAALEDDRFYWLGEAGMSERESVLQDENATLRARLERMEAALEAALAAEEEKR